jgi:membrane protein DedA with SNARE-associated domain
MTSMLLMISLTETIKAWADYAIQTGGLLGAAILMALESMIVPIPSEVIMPPLGMAVHKGTFSWPAAMIATSMGSLVGSLISYYLGYIGGKPLVMKVGRFLLLNEHHLDLTTSWFHKWGSLTVFISRFIPVVRHFISIPAGIARMNLLKFALYTLIGATLWNGFLLWLGYKLQAHWEDILTYRKPIDMAIIVLLVMGVVAWYAIHLRKPKSKMTP